MNLAGALSLGGEAQSFPEGGDQPNNLFGTFLIAGGAVFLDSFLACSHILSGPWDSLT